MRTIYVFAALTACYIIITLFITAFFVEQHERVHQQIYRSFGIESDIELYLWGLGGGHTNATISNMTKSDYQTMNALQDVNEIVHYQYSILLILMFSLLFLNLVFLVVVVRSGSRQTNRIYDSTRMHPQNYKEPWRRSRHGYS